jgi:serine/threonine protein kinase
LPIVSPQPVVVPEPIPGYWIRRRISSGGYGEVWAAEAPGRLKKAIKFVYGCPDHDRARQELAALDRIKGVRHPFLLSLERIEVIDGQLLIVTELADGNLKDCFDQHRGRGRRGIPRRDLLDYLRDAAEALDFLAERHGLQHLDVKPENLLLLADRIKLADFGLVRSFRETSSSPLGGLTPTYAPPELFDGRPTRHSDQYSLAIVYQQLLTGSTPFSGNTVADLARQHFHEPPRLNELPDADRNVLARSLSKDPRQRYSSCVDLLEHLTAASATLDIGGAEDAVRGEPGGETSLQCDTELIPQGKIVSAVD